MKAYNVSGVMVVKDGKVMLERYGLGRKPEDRWISFSVTKSITSTLVGAAIQDGKIKSPRRSRSRATSPSSRARPMTASASASSSP